MLLNRSKYQRTDMALEACQIDEDGSLRGIVSKEKSINGFSVTEMQITTPEASALIGKPQGKYITIAVGKIWLQHDEIWDVAAEIIANELKKLIYESGAPDGVLIAGLGNRSIVSDAIGPMTAEKITANRHIKESDPSLFEKLRSLPISAVIPGVTGQTGMEALELIKGASDAVRPSVIIVIDALASKSVDRLGSTVQISDTGISPGSGIGNRRHEISYSTLGVPVISIGIPTVVDSSTLVFDTLEKAGVTEISEALERELENGRSFFVTLKDADTVISEMSSLLSRSLHIALSL